MWPMQPIIVSSIFLVVLHAWIISLIPPDQAMCLCSGRVTVSVLKLKSHLRMVFVSDNPPSTVNLYSAIIFLQGIGSFALFGWAVTSIAKGIAASSQSVFMVLGRLTVSPILLSI